MGSQTDYLLGESTYTSPNPPYTVDVDTWKLDGHEKMHRYIGQ